MLTLEAPYYYIRDVVIFRDHEDPDIGYFLPGTVRLSEREEGATAFTLYKYRRDLTDNPDLDPTMSRGGGLALFEVDLAVERLQLIQSELASATGRPDIRLLPATFRTARASTILARSENDGFIEDAFDGHAASLVPPHRGAFAVALSPEGATLFEEAARGGQLPAGVVYDFTFLALTPSLHAKVTMDYERIYDRFAASIGFSYYVSVKLDVDLAWLVENGHIQIEITSFVDAEDARRQEELVLELVKARVVADFFRSGIPPKQPPGPTGPLADMLGGLLGGTEITSATALFVIKARYEAVRERKKHTLLFNGRTAVEMPHSVVGMLSTLGAAEEGEPPRIDVRPLDLDDEFFSVLDVRVDSVADFERMPDLREVIAHLARGEHRTSFVFDRDGADTGRFQVALDDRTADEYEVELEFHFDGELGSGPERIDVGPFKSRRRAFVINPREHLIYRGVEFIRGPVDGALVPKIALEAALESLPAEGEPRETLLEERLELSDGNERALWRYRLPAGTPVDRIRARVRWQDPTGEEHELEDELLEPGAESAVILGPYRDVLNVVVQPAGGWDRLRQVLVELRYEDGDRRQDHVERFDAEHDDEITVSFPLMDPAARAFSWRETLFEVDGSAEERDWREADRTFIVAGITRDAPHEIRIVWIGQPGDALGMRVDVWAPDRAGTEQQLSTFLRAGERDATISVPRIEGEPLEYRYEARRFSLDGEELTQSGDDQSSTLLVLQ